MTGSTSSTVVGTERGDVCPALGQTSTRSQRSGCSPCRAAGTPYSYRHPLLAWGAEPRCAVTVNPVSVSQTKRECQEGRDGLSPRHPSLGPGLEMSMANASSFHFLPEKGPSPGLGRLSFSFKFTDAEFDRLWEEPHLPGPAPLPWACCMQKAYGDRGQASRSWPSRAAPPGRPRSCRPWFGRAPAVPGCRCHRLPNTAGRGLPVRAHLPH